MTEATTDALQQMARHVATQLVVDALKDMVAHAPTLPVTVTLHPQPVRRLLAPKPAKRRGRKPGPKSKKWTPEQRANFTATMEARRQVKAAPVAPVRRGRPRKEPAASETRCTKCDHTKDEHDGAGKCLSFRCSCTGFYR